METGKKEIYSYLGGLKKEAITASVTLSVLFSNIKLIMECCIFKLGSS